MVYSRRLVLVHRSVASYMMLLVMLHIYRNVWDNNAPRVGAWPYLTGSQLHPMWILPAPTLGPSRRAG